MPIYLPKLDYGPLYQAYQYKGAAARAQYLPKQIELKEEMFALQRSERRRETITDIASNVLQLGQAVFQIASQAKLEKEKKELIEAQQEASDTTRNMILNNDYELVMEGGSIHDVERGETPRAVVKLGPNFDKWYQEKSKAIEERCKLFPEVRTWAKDQLANIYASSKDASYQYVLQKEMHDRNVSFEQNLSEAMTQAIAKGDFGIVESIFQGITWMSPTEKLFRIEAARKDFDLGITEREIRAVTQMEGYDAGIAAVNEKERSGAVSAEQAQKLKQTVLTQSKETLAFFQQQSETAFQKAIEEGKVPSSVVEEISGNVPDPFQDQVEQVLRVKQERWAHDRTTDEFNRVRDNLEELKTLYKRTKKDEAGWYDGTPEQQRLDLEMLQREIDQQEQRRKSQSPSESDIEKWAARELEFIKQQVIRGEINVMQARRMMDDRGLQASPSVYGRGMEWLASYISPQAEQFVKEMNDIVKSAMRKMWGLGEKKALSPEQELAFAEASTWFQGAALDFVRENPKATETELREKFQSILSKYYSKDYDVLRQPAIERARRPADMELAEVQAMIDHGELDQLIYTDIDQVQKINPQFRAKLEQLWAREQAIVAEKLGVGFDDVRMDLAAEGPWDVGARAIFTTKEGNRYTFFAPDGKKLVLFRLDRDPVRGDQWVHVEAPEERQREKIPASATEETRKARERGMEAAAGRLGPVPTPAPREPRTPEEREAEEARKRAQEALEKAGFRGLGGYR